MSENEEAFNIFSPSKILVIQWLNLWASPGNVCKETINVLEVIFSVKSPPRCFWALEPRVMLHETNADILKDIFTRAYVLNNADDQECFAAAAPCWHPVCLCKTIWSVNQQVCGFNRIMLDKVSQYEISKSIKLDIIQYLWTLMRLTFSCNFYASLVHLIKLHNKNPFSFNCC